MEIISRIIEQLPLEEREYTDKNGQPQKFHSVGFVLGSGVDTFFAELTGEAALAAGTFDPNCYYKADLSLRVDRWTDQTGKTRFGTRMYINRIGRL